MELVEYRLSALRHRNRPGLISTERGTPMTQPTGPVPAERWVRYVGTEAKLIVHGVGEWLTGEAKSVEGWLAERLLSRPDFAGANSPVVAEVMAEEPAPPGPPPVAMPEAAAPDGPPPVDMPTPDEPQPARKPRTA